MTFAKTIALLVFSALASMAAAGDIKPYSQLEFDKLTQGGKPVLLDISATWCPTCKAQQPIIEGLMTRPAYKDVTVLTIDYDTSKATLRKFQIRTQSTLVAFKGSTEVGRSVGDTSVEGIEGLVKKTVN